MALAPLGERHIERAGDRAGDGLGVVGVDQQGLLALGGRPGKAGQDQHAGIVGVLGRDIFLGHEIHAVAERGDERSFRRAVEPGKRRAAIGLVEIADRRPGDFAVHTVDAPRRRAHRLLKLGIFGNLRAALRRDLQEGHLAAPFGMQRIEALEGLHPLHQPLGIVETVHADHQILVAEALHHVLHEG